MSWILLFHLLCHKIIFREKSYGIWNHGIWDTFMVLGTNTNNFWRHPARKVCMCNRDTILESHERLEKTVYCEKSVKVCRSRQLWVVFWLFHSIRTKYAKFLWSLADSLSALVFLCCHYIFGSYVTCLSLSFNSVFLQLHSNYFFVHL